MSAYPDTSFLCALYRKQDNSREAVAFTEASGTAMLAKFQANVASRGLMIVSADWPEVHQMAERLSTRHTPTGGHRGFDILHVATALQLGAREFLTFDANQKKLAQAEGLKVPL